MKKLLFLFALLVLFTGACKHDPQFADDGVMPEEPEPAVSICDPDMVYFQNSIKPLQQLP